MLELVKQIGEAVVQVRTPSGLGSGFFINEDGFLITNFHVIESETQISIEVYHQQARPARPQDLQADPHYRAEQVCGPGAAEGGRQGRAQVQVCPAGQRRCAVGGEKVFAIGSPLGLERTVTEGILSTKTREMAGTLYLQTTAQINPGNSGGPLFNLSGEVIGVTNMKATAGEGLGFAIPVESVKFFLDHRDAFAYSNDNPGNPYRYLEPPSRTRHATVEP